MGSAELFHVAGGNKMLQPLCQTGTYDRTILLLMFTQEESVPESTRSLQGMFITALLLRDPNWKQLKCPSTGEWVNSL